MEDINTEEKVFATLEFDFFRVQLKFAFKIRPLILLFFGLYLLFFGLFSVGPLEILLPSPLAAGSSWGYCRIT